MKKNPRTETIDFFRIAGPIAYVSRRRFFAEGRRFA
jgi:hypothetical protein